MQKLDEIRQQRNATQIYEQKPAKLSSDVVVIEKMKNLNLKVQKSTFERKGNFRFMLES